MKYNQLTLRYVPFLNASSKRLQMFLVTKMCVGDLGGWDLHPVRIPVGCCFSACHLHTHTHTPLFIDGLFNQQHQHLFFLSHKHMLMTTMWINILYTYKNIKNTFGMSTKEQMRHIYKANLQVLCIMYEYSSVFKWMEKNNKLSTSKIQFTLAHFQSDTFPQQKNNQCKCNKISKIV